MARQSRGSRADARLVDGPTVVVGWTDVVFPDCDGEVPDSPCCARFNRSS